ncbi:hypothetical protein ACRQ4C_11355 [Curtobacterium sp. SP.BCp]|uniref:hypothetical protein n=1 Tax=Curtobacterium sp. SP.BCp TaxID=3435230 RepID=UPI003F739ED0
MQTTRPRRRPLRTSLAMVAALAVAVTGLTFGTVLAEQTTTESASAATASAFDPGNIISDANFYNGSAMSASGVQSFLNSVAPNCRQQSGAPKCLKDFTQNVPAIKAVAGRCAAIAGGTKSGATIIAQVGAACGISQKALLVLLQKEQGIVATSAPTNWMYQHATGFACPDTAPCDPAYRGFAQQVYAAALQFKRYQASPTYWAYQAGRNNSILLNPNAACGRKTVYIKNQATAGLYIYTPYTPNTAAMNNLYGSGDACSAYGNRNFWRMYTDWFGSPTGGSSPYGNVDSVTVSSTSLTVSGWAVDPDVLTKALRVAFYVDGVGKRTVTGDIARSDLAGSLGAGNTKHGFSTTLTGMSQGSHSVCVYAINQGPGSNTMLGCTPFTVTSAPPKGVLDTAKGGTGTIALSGWVLDPDSSKPAPYRVQIDGKQVVNATANVVRNDVAKVYKGVGSTVGFSTTVKNVTPGSRVVTLWTQDKPGTSWTKVATKTATVTMPTTGPTGKTGTVKARLDQATPAVGKVTVKGWAFDPDVYDRVPYRVLVDGKVAQTGTANGRRADVEKVYPGWGPNVGVQTTLTGVAAGKHTVALQAMDRPSGKWVAVGSKSVTVPAVAGATGKTGPVYGAYDVARGGKGTITVSGWAIDPDTVNPVTYRVDVDGKTVHTALASGTRKDVERAHPGYGSDVGLSVTLTGQKAGRHTVALWFQELPSGAWKQAGSKTATVS